MQPTIGSRVDKQATNWLAAIAHHLYPGEAVVALAHSASVRPLFDGLAVTNARVVAFLGSDLRNGFRLEVPAADIASVQTGKPRFSKATLTVTRRDGRTISLGVVPDSDMGMALGAVRKLSETGPAVDVGPTMAQQAELAVQAQDKSQREPPWV